MNRIELKINDDKTQTVVTPQVLVEGENLTTEIALIGSPVSWVGSAIRALITTPLGKLVDAVDASVPVPLTNTMLDGKGTLYVEFAAMKGGTEIARTVSPALLPVSAARSLIGDIDPEPLPDLVAEMVAAKGDCDGAAAAAVLATERIETTDAAVQAAETVRGEAEQSRAAFYNGFNAKLDSLATIVKYNPEIADYTSIIQSALNQKGIVKIVGSGTFVTGKLLIDSDTILDIGAGVTLKRKNGTNASIIVNKGHTTNTRDKNIWIKGGIWDGNRDNNPSSSFGNLSVNSDAWSGQLILMDGVDGLKITDVVKIGNEWKYCYLVANCNNIYCGNIRFENESDGLHFQPPISNLVVENITGYTHDDMVAFTMGDYPPYALGVTGDIENVIVRNIYAALGTKEHIKLVGDGLNHTCKFRNMRFENIRGEATVSSCCILQRDQAVPNSYLNNTYLENIVFSGIQPKLSGQIPAFLISASSGDITIENCNWDQSGSSRFIQVVSGNNGLIDKLTIRNVKSLTPVAYAMSSMVRCDSSMTIKQLNIDDCRLDFSVATSGEIIYQTSNSIKEINIANSWISIGSTSSKLIETDGTSATPISIRVSNSYIKTQFVLITSTEIDIGIQNTTLVTAYVAYLNDGGNVRLRSANSKYSVAIVTNTLTPARKFSMNGTDLGFGGLVSSLTAIEGDMVRSSNASEVSGKGVYYYNGASWSKIAG